MRNYRWLIVILGIAFAVLIGFGIYTAISRAGKEPVTVHLIPEDATLTANGERLGQGTAYLKPGEYTIEATRSGFESQKTTVFIQSNAKAGINAIDIALTPVSDEAKKWQQEHQKLYYDFEGRSGEQSNLKGEEFSEKNPIASQLPYENFLYTIGYKSDPSDPSGNSIIIEINAPPGYRRAALKQIIELGYDPTDYKINFNDYESPFENE